MKTATSLVVPVIVSTVLDEWFRMHVVHGGVVEASQDAVDVIGRVVVRNARRQGLSTCLELAMEELVYVDHCFVVSDMPKALVE